MAIPQRGGLGRFSLKTLFVIMIGMVMTAYLAFGLWTWKVMAQVEVNGPEYHRVVLGKDLIADILPPPKYIIETYLVTLQLDRAQPTERAALIERLKVLKKEYDERQTYWIATEFEPDLKQAMIKTTHEPAMRYYSVLFERFIPALQAGDDAARASALADMDAAYQQHRAAVDDLVAKTNAFNTRVEKETADTIAEGQWGMLSIWLLALLAVSGFTVALARYLLRVLGGDPRVAMEVVQAIASNDLHQPVKVQMGDTQSLLAAMAAMQSHLKSVIGEVNAAAQELSSASQHLTDTSQQVSLSSSEQSEAVMSVAAAMEEVAIGIAHISDNAEGAHRLASESHDRSVSGIELAQSASLQMAELQGTVEASSSKISALQANSELIRSAAETIRNIADQTNLLALNAAIEAARAGEAGRGFAVVADEVRKLAENTARATGEIDQVIQAIHVDMNHAVETMGDGVNRVGEGVSVTRALGDSMQELASGADGVVSTVSEITMSLRQQTAAHEQVAANVETIARMSEANTGEVKRIASAAQTLAQLAQRLQGAISVFRLN
ncbi:methyl-accepting chemotaxis protein [Rivihabitans pingtungensis]|uniref:methyl-accepting chemotaxis protein n=1 Tax=Rivihabitans pingtungensis TaxID=1054498 RepID=UPI002FDA6C3F